MKGGCNCDADQLQNSYKSCQSRHRDQLHFQARLGRGVGCLRFSNPNDETGLFCGGVREGVSTLKGDEDQVTPFILLYFQG